ncbi:MAG TPA: hypothetical protein VF076_07135 [Acidimicrobiales bacterium]
MTANELPPTDPNAVAADEVLKAVYASGNVLHFHQGDGTQFAPASGDPPPSGLRVPESRPRFGTDADGNPIVAPAAGLVFDPETGSAGVPKAEEKEGRHRGAPAHHDPAHSGTSGTPSARPKL